MADLRFAGRTHPLIDGMERAVEPARIVVEHVGRLRSVGNLLK
jgi:hypothetical protein